MNRKGFTLVELLGAIVILAIIVAIITPSVMRILKNSDEANYNMMIDNIITGSKMYYEECKYGDIKNSDGSKKICSSSVDLTLGDLVRLGFVTGTNEENKLIIKDPKTDKDISNCSITINVSTDTNTGKVTYEVIGTSGGNCPNGNLGSTN